VPVVARRDDTAGLPGVVLVATADLGLALWDAVWTSGARLGLVAIGRHAVDALRLEAGRPVAGRDVGAGDDPWGAGLGSRVRLDKGPFLGRPALERRLRAGAPARRLVTLVLDDPRAVVLGDEPVLAPGSATAAGHVTGGGTAPGSGLALARAWLSASHAAPGTRVGIEYFGERLAARVADDPRTAGAAA
jgi:glycine cleavage system aminomethyltransferase T